MRVNINESMTIDARKASVGMYGGCDYPYNLVCVLFGTTSSFNYFIPVDIVAAADSTLQKKIVILNTFNSTSRC